MSFVSMVDTTFPQAGLRIWDKFFLLAEDDASWPNGLDEVRADMFAQPLYRWLKYPKDQELDACVLVATDSSCYDTMGWYRAPINENSMILSLLQMSHNVADFCCYGVHQLTRIRRSSTGGIGLVRFNRSHLVHGIWFENESDAVHFGIMEWDMRLEAED